MYLKTHTSRLKKRMDYAAHLWSTNRGVGWHLAGLGSGGRGEGWLRWLDHGSCIDTKEDLRHRFQRLRGGLCCGHDAEGHNA